jgi:hypothetical protein
MTDTGPCNVFDDLNKKTDPEEEEKMGKLHDLKMVFYKAHQNQDSVAAKEALAKIQEITTPEQQRDILKAALFKEC